MKKIRTQQSVLLLFMVCIIQISCKKLVDIQTPKNQLTGNQIFADSVNASAVINGIYYAMISTTIPAYNSGAITIYTGLYSDELSQTGTDASQLEIYSDNINSNNSINQNLWTQAYKSIYQINAGLEGVAGSATLSTAAKAQLTGELKCVRAFDYFNLVNIYGPVPIVTTTDYSVNRLTVRNSIDDVYKFIIADCNDAKKLLPSTNIITSRANYYAAAALLAKASLYTGDYNTANNNASEIINSGQFKIVSDLNSVFLANSQELIWKLVPTLPNKETTEGQVFVPTSSSSKPKYTVANNLYNSFEIGDQRKMKWINVNVVSKVNYAYPYKYKKATTTSTPTENYSLFRLGEIYLISAEAKYNLGDLVGAVADLNITRARAGLSKITISEPTQFPTAILKERQEELFCEWGNRFYDLKRFKKTDDVLSPLKPNWKSSAAFFPIPINEVTANPNLTQNSGY